MKNTNSRFLESLTNHTIPENANNYMLSTYSIILEAWRRGLEIKIRIVLEKSGAIEPYYSISDGKDIHHFSTTRGDLVSIKAKDLTKNKVSAKEYLIKNGVPTPEGKEFSETAINEEIIQYAADIGYPVVVKPVAGTGGKGVIAEIENEEELEEALAYVRNKLKSPNIILEKYYKGEDYRLYVLDGKVIGAIKRIKSHVIGDGENTVKQLIEIKNKERAKLPSLTNRPIKIDDESRTLLKRKSYDLDSIIPKDEVVYLKSKNNVSAGGDSIDVTDQLTDNIKNIAVTATESFPSLPHCGLDMIVDEENDTGVIIELNSRAHITQHLFPMKGQARDIPSFIIDYYFPETKYYDRLEANKIYIDYDFIYNACLSRTANEIKIPTIQKSPIVLKRYLLSNCRYTKKFAERIRRLAFNKKVNGYIKSLESKKVVIVVGGTDKQIDQFYKSLEKYSQKAFKNVNISEKNRTSPIAHGFHIMENTQVESNNTGVNANEYIKKYSNLKSDYQELVRKLADYEQKEKIMELTKKQNKQLKKRLKQMELSSSWRVTRPIRTVSSLIKSKK